MYRAHERGLQTRGVMVDLCAYVGLEAVGRGDVLCLRTGFDRALLAQYADPAMAFDPHRCSGLDGFDERLQRWVTDSGVAALLSDNEAVEYMPDFVRQDAHGIRVPPLRLPGAVGSPVTGVGTV